MVSLNRAIGSLANRPRLQPKLCIFGLDSDGRLASLGDVKEPREPKGTMQHVQVRSLID